MTKNTSVTDKFNHLIEIMRRLRAPDGCPWDKEQTLSSLKRYIIEEAYELIEAIENADNANICEEAGDLLLQVVFVSIIADEQNFFNLSNVIDGISDKLKRRHPHVFGDLKLNDKSEVLNTWEKIKSRERKQEQNNHSILEGIPKTLPSLLKAYRMQERAANVGFDWPKGAIATVLQKIDEEISEVKDAIKTKNKHRIEDEIGDSFFSIVNLCRHLEIDPEESLNNASRKFALRFQHIEETISNSKKTWSDFSLEELEAFWIIAKLKENDKKIKN